ncbi:hypothetical protein DD595_25790, partial [Enterobacter cloacae complex sp. 4DZ3-17B2]|uniref:hypothetical protein n=1 Tax=Enterobacter cloacae complex sp. 4DZ3-17B2 TaxID=2511990 RepID=UPI0010253D64
TMFMCKSFQQSSCDKLLDKGWYAMEEIGLRCEVALDTLVVKYMIARQSLLLSFWYMRSQMLNGKYIPMDQVSTGLEDNPAVDVEVIDKEHGLMLVVTIRELCSLLQLRHDIIEESMYRDLSDFSFFLAGHKVMRRREKDIL